MLSKRWETMSFLFSGAVISYMLRVNISVCAQKMRDELDWSESEKGLILSSFFWGYAIGQMPASFVADKIGSKATFGFAILSPSILTLLVPLASRTSFGAALCLRALIGLGAAGTFPSCYHFYPRWVPVMERTKLIAYVCSGMYVGEMFGFALSGLLVGADMNIGGMHIEGWEVVFYTFGLFGVVWFPFFLWRVHNLPDEHPTISPEELAFIKDGNTFYSEPLHSPDSTTSSEYSPDAFKASNSADFDKDDEKDQGGQWESDKEGQEEQMTRPLLGDSDIRARRISSRSSDQDGASLRQRHRSTSSSIVMAMAEGIAPPVLEGFVDSSADLSTVPMTPVVTSLSADTSLGRGRKLGPATTGESGPSKAKRSRSIREIPWRAIFTHPTSLTLLVNYWTFAWIGYMVLTELPSYLTDVLGYELADAGLLSIAPYAANYISVMVFSWFFDYMQVERGWTTTEVRQWAERIALLGSGGCLIICGFMKSPEAAFSFMVLALFFFGAIQSGLSCAFIDVSPNFSNTMSSVGNAIGAVAGFMGPIVVSILITAFEGRTGWQLAFYLTGLMCVVSLVFWKLYQTSEVIPSLNTPVSYARYRV